MATKRRRQIEDRLRDLEKVRGVRMACLEYDVRGLECGCRWAMFANTRTGEKTFICANLMECERSIDELERICRDESRLSDDECDQIVNDALGRMNRSMP